MSTPDDNHFDPDDPRLTAYALGELPDPADRAHVESLLAASPEARAELADIRALTDTLTAEYERDRLAPAAAAIAAPVPTNVIPLPEPRWGWVRPWLAVAAVLLLVAVGYSSLPVFNSVQVKGQHVRAMAAAMRESSKPSKQDFALPSVGTSARVRSEEPASEGSVVLSPTTPKPAEPSAESVPLLAQVAQAPPPPTFELQDTSGPDKLASTTPPASAPAAYAGTLALANEPATTLAQGRITVSGSAGGGHALARAKLDSRYTLSKDSAANTAAAMPMFADAPAIVAAAPPVAPGAAKSMRAGVDAERGLRLLAKEEAVDGYGLADESKLGDKKTLRRPDGAFNTAAYDHITETPFLAAKDNPLSTFSVDVDTASYSLIRRFIELGSLPPPGAVRIEEMLNYFPYSYAPPTPGDERPFAVHVEGASCPWNPDHRLVRVALKGRELAPDKRPPSNLVFLIDVSGSMEPAERLPLIKESLRLLVERLTDDDHVAIVVYAGNSGLVLPSTNGAHKDTILRALDHLEAGGSTNGASGIKLAYKVAQQNFIQGGTNRVILATDGDFNVGTTSQGELVRLVETERKGGVFLTCLGVGTDNLKDSTMQKLADHGNGNYAYLDRIEEGRKVLVEQMSGTLVTIAKDVKIQVEFNPAAVQSYRLIGYEKRLLRKEDFNDDRVDAGEIGAGHSVTALYEIVPAGLTDAAAAPAVDALKYQPAPESGPVRATTKPVADAHETLTVKIRHKAPDSETSERSYESAFVDHATTGTADFANATPDFKFAAAVATFGLVLRDSPYKGNATLGAAIELAQDGKGHDAEGYRAGFIELVRRAAAFK